MTTELQTEGIISHVVSLSPSFSLQHSTTEYAALLAEFPAVTKPCVSPQPVRHTVTHHICTTGSPVHARARRLPAGHLRIARQEFEHKMEQGIVQTSDSQWSSPLHMVPKKTPGDWRPETMRRLPCVQSSDCPGLISDTTHPRFHCNPTWHHHLLETRLGACISSDSCRAI